MNLTKNTDMATVVHAMSQPDSGLEVRDRMWLKITIPQAFIGQYFSTFMYLFFVLVPKSVDLYSQLLLMEKLWLYASLLGVKC